MSICILALAALAEAGKLAAIVTTNFDRLIERAMERAGVPFLVVCDQAGFVRLGEKWKHGTLDALSIVKIHGSTDVIESLIDTRKQRRRRRGPALTRVLTYLLQKYPFLFTGFSGADLRHDLHCLGIWDAAELSPGFCFLYQPSRPPREVIFRLKEHYGSKAELVEIDSAEALEYLANAQGVVPMQASAAADLTATSDLVQSRIQAWADQLESWLAIRMLASLLESASMRVNALRILKKAVQQGPRRYAGVFPDSGRLGQS